MYKGETDTSNRTSRIQFIVHIPTVPGQAVVKMGSLGTGEAIQTHF